MCGVEISVRFVSVRMYLLLVDAPAFRLSFWICGSVIICCVYFQVGLLVGFLVDFSCLLVLKVLVHGTKGFKF